MGPALALGWDPLECDLQWDQEVQWTWAHQVWGLQGLWEAPPGLGCLLPVQAWGHP